MDAPSRTQTEVTIAYIGNIVAWFSFLLMVHMMDPPHRGISTLVLVGSVIWAAYAIAAGFLMRKKFFAQSTKALHGDDPDNASKGWRSANIIGFCCAQNLTIVGVVLKFLGASWALSGMFFAIGLAFLLLWRPRRLAMKAAQPA
jgi:hypothetical protein